MADDRVRYVGQDPRLGRHVNHDPRSRRFPARSDVPLQSVTHERHVPVFDQGSLGSCTGNAALGCLATGPFWDTLTGSAHQYGPLTPTGRVPWTVDGAEQIYSAATSIDAFPGAWPPEDTGSDGLSVAKVLHGAGLISGYLHAFSLADMLASLMNAPCIVGTEWTEGMWNPDHHGIIHPTGTPEGGHEYVCDGYDQDRGLVWFTNSWGVAWGVDGRHAMPAEEFGQLLARQGDATFFTPLTAPAPTPEPAEDPDAELADLLRTWAGKRDASNCRKQRAAVRDWLLAKGL